jgi:hypothetical protein
MDGAVHELVSPLRHELLAHRIVDASRYASTSAAAARHCATATLGGIAIH